MHLIADSGQPVLQRIIRECSRLLLVVGAALFLVGDKFLYEIKHVSFLVSEVVGILGGVLVMLLGSGIAIAGDFHGRSSTLIRNLITPYSDWPTWLQILVLGPNALLAGYACWAWWPKSSCRCHTRRS